MNTFLVTAFIASPPGAAKLPPCADAEPHLDTFLSPDGFIYISSYVHAGNGEKQDS